MYAVLDQSARPPGGRRHAVLAADRVLRDAVQLLPVAARAARPASLVVVSASLIAPRPPTPSPRSSTR